MLNTKPVRYDPKGEAVRREQQRNADLDREERNKLFPTIFVKGYGFRPYYSGHDTIHIKGPLCPGSITKDRTCLAPLTSENAQSSKANCDVCGRKYELPNSYEELRNIADKAYQGLLHSEAQPITLDVPYEAVKAESEDDTRKIKVVWSQKDGRNQAIIYLINKDDSGKKTHIFADLDREEVRYDPDDIPPGKVLAKIKATFAQTNVEIEYEKK